MALRQDAVILENVTCEFPGTRALNSVNLTFLPGETHAITGENGAGKSTLLKVLAGAVKPCSGRINVFGRSYESIRRAWKLGIRAIPQEPLLAQSLSVAENVFLGRLPRKSRVRVNWPVAVRRTSELLQRVGLSHLDPKQPVRGLEIGEQQLIQTARALAHGGRIFLFDEPTSALTPAEILKLDAAIRDLAAHGAVVLFISHRMPEIFSLCDRVSVLRDGNCVSTGKTAETTPDVLIRAMVGRDISSLGRPRAYGTSQVASGARSLSVTQHDQGPELGVHRGEIVGLAGLVGCGRTGLLESIFGIRPHHGNIAVNGKTVRISHPRDAIRAGIAYIPQDRKRDGLVLALTIENNLALPNFASISRLAVVAAAKKRRLSLEWIARLKVKCTGPLQPARTLSGGNQQKIVLAKWLVRNPVALLLDEPTRGVDIGAKTEIHEIIRALAARGVGVLLASSEMPELMQLCHRILVMREGKIVDELCDARISEEEILRSAVPGAHAVAG